MGRNNGTFKYTVIQESQRDSDTGFYYSASDTSDWFTGGDCQIEKTIPAKQILGEDGQMHAYTYDVFIPKHFKGELSVGAQIQITSEDGITDVFTIQGVDNLNRKYIEVWG